jgi:hypothetical protein
MVHKTFGIYISLHKEMSLPYINASVLVSRDKTSTILGKMCFLLGRQEGSFQSSSLRPDRTKKETNSNQQEEGTTQLRRRSSDTEDRRRISSQVDSRSCQF